MNKPKILVIDDNEDVLSTNMEILEMYYEVRGAEDGSQALDVLRGFVPDLILCDIMMPVMDGYQVLMRVKENPVTARAAFVFITAMISRAEQRLGMNLGADDYLTKPYTVQELLDLVDARLQVKSQRDQEMEEILENLKSSLMYSLPHELRTPLTAMMGYVDFVMEDADRLSPQDVRNMLKPARRASQRLYRLVENYLLYAQLEILEEREKRQILLQKAESEDIKLVIETTIQDFVEQHNIEGRTIELDLVDATVSIVGDDLRKIVLELLDNAVKFSLPKSIIHVKSAVQDGYFRLSFTNEGRGMTAEQIEQIGAFMQFDRHLQEQQGSGLGLIITKRIAQLYDGDLKIKSDADAETIATIYLPARGASTA